MQLIDKDKVEEILRNLWKEENRKRKSDMWLASKRFSEGKYDFYFNLDDVKNIFCKEVSNLAHILHINYKLEII